MLRYCYFLTLSFLLSLTASAELRLAQIFQDNMILQREMKAPVWGWTDAGGSVQVSFAGQQKTTKADAQGHWLVELDPLAASAEGRPLKVEAGAAHLERKNVLVGEVWVLAGQSNMTMTLKGNALMQPFFKDFANDAEYPLIRFTDFGFGASLKPLDDVDPFVRKETPWKILSKTTAPDASSIGFFFGKYLNKELKVPVGLVQVSVPGTPQTAWMPREALESFPGEDGKRNYFESRLAAGEANLVKTNSPFKTWAEFEQAEEKWRHDPAATDRSWPGGGIVPDFPGALYNTRVHPLAPLAFRGVLWHQGEAGPYGDHGARMVAMVKQWREVFKNNFYFIFGTMTRFTKVPPPLTPQLIAHRAGIDEQFMVADRAFGSEGHAAEVNFFDLGNTGTHWGMKEEAGRRMALAALDHAYGQKQVFTGPQPIDIKIKGNQVECRFRYVGDGLKYEPSIDGISGFVITDAKGAAQWANVKVTAPDTLVASHPAIAEPNNLYYAWHSNPHETLFNSQGFPAFPFRMTPANVAKTDDPAPLVQKLSGGSGKTELNISHVRRNGYVFSAQEPKGSGGGTVVVKAYIPSEWKGLEIREDGKTLQPAKTSTESGHKFVELSATINGAQIVIADQGAAEAMAKVNRY